MPQLQLTRDKLIILYKILNDSLFLLIVFFFLALIAEGLVFGIVSSHFSFLRIIFLIFLNLFAIYAVGYFSKIDISKQKINKKIAVFLAISATVLIFNSLFKLTLIWAIIILLLTILSGYLIYKIILD